MKYLKYLILFFLLCVLAHLLVISIDGLWDNYKKADVVLILGNTVKSNGELSERLKARVEKGMELYKQGFVKKIIVSGGLGSEGFYEGTEMKNSLILQGVNTNDIITDNAGNTTYLFVKNCAAICKQYQFHSVIIVSQFFHISRTKMILKSLGVKNVYSAHADYFELRDVYALLREFVAYYSYLIKYK